MKIYQSVEELIGNTPLLRLHRLEKACELNAVLLAKIEGFNPAGSVKDRAALYMINAAEREGKLTPGAVIIEPTSGNTGIGLAAICAVRGYRAVIVMPDTMSPERIALMRGYGAEVILTPGKEGMQGAIIAAQKLAKDTPNAFIPSQFENPANALAHEETTAQEIISDTDGAVDVFVAGIGTGGTISGVGRALKKAIPAVKIVGVEPESSPVITKGKAGAHGLQGIGAGFIPTIYDAAAVDKVETATERDAFTYARLLGKTEGVLCGISGGAALAVAVLEAKKKENEGKTIVVLLPDSGEKYLSTPLFQPEK